MPYYDGYNAHRKHEWDKHGTCAMSLDALGSEYKYFKKGLDLNLQYNLLRSGSTSHRSLSSSHNNTYIIVATR